MRPDGQNPRRVDVGLGITYHTRPVRRFVYDELGRAARWSAAWPGKQPASGANCSGCPAAPRYRPLGLSQPTEPDIPSGPQPLRGGRRSSRPRTPRAAKQAGRMHAGAKTRWLGPVNLNPGSERPSWRWWDRTSGASLPARRAQGLTSCFAPFCPSGNIYIQVTCFILSVRLV